MQFREIFTSIGALFTNLFEHPDWRNLVDVAILAVLIYNVIKLVIHTRSNSLFKGIAVVLIMAWIASILRFNAVSWLLNQIISMGLLVLVILFQPEFRRGLDQIGRSRFMRRMFGPIGRQEEAEQVEKPVTEIVRAMNDMARKKIGALIVVEHAAARRRDDHTQPAHQRRGLHIAAVIRSIHQQGPGHAPSGGHRHHRDHGRGIADRFGGDRHHLHGQGGQDYTPSG